MNTTLQLLGSQLTDAVNGASFNGLNLLDGSTAGAALSFVSGYNVSSAGVASFSNISLTSQALTGTGGVASTTVAPNITDATTIASLNALTDNTGSATLGYGTDVIDKTTDTTGDTFTISSQDLAGTTTTTTYTGLDANGNVTTAAAAVTFGVSVKTTPAAGLLIQGGDDLTNLTTTAGTAAAQLTQVDKALQAVTTYSSIIGSTSNAMTTAANFNTSLSTNYTTGISALVDADMNSFDPPAGPADAAAAWRSVAVDRQPEHPVDPQTVPVSRTVRPETPEGGSPITKRKAALLTERGLFLFRRDRSAPLERQIPQGRRSAPGVNRFLGLTRQTPIITDIEAASARRLGNNTRRDDLEISRSWASSRFVVPV